jgi:hypothetical protein
MVHSAFIGVIVNSVSGRHKNLCLKVGTSIDQVHLACLPACLVLCHCPILTLLKSLFANLPTFLRYLYPKPNMQLMFIQKTPTINIWSISNLPV